MRLFTVVFLAAVACNRNDPMSPSPVPSPPPVPAVRPGVVVLPGGLDTFSCADADEVRVRVNSVEDNRVGLHVRISGIPEGGKRLRVRWRRDVVRDVRIGSAEDSFSDVLSYVYGGLTGPETFVVRVELLVDGRSGSCSRNRRVRVRPPASAHDGGSSDADTTGTGSDTDTTGTGSDTDTTGTGSDADTTGTGSDTDTTGTGSDTDTTGTGSDTDTTGTGSDTDTTGTGSDADTTGTGSDADTTGTGSDADTTGTGSDTDTTGTGSDTDTTGTGSDADTTGTGSDTDTTGTGSDTDTTGTGSDTDTTGTGSDADTTGTGSDTDTTGTGSDADTTGTGSDTDTTGTGSDASVWKPGDNYYGELHSREWSRLTVDGLRQGQPIENGIPVYDTPFTVVCGFVGDVSVGCKGVIGEVVETGGSAGEWVRVPVEE